MKRAIETGLLITAVVVVIWLYRLYRLANQLQVFNNIQVHNLDTGGINLTANSLIKNPTDVSLSITKPFISLYLPGESSPFASSVIDSGIVTFEPDSQSVISTKIPIDYQNAVSLPMKLISNTAIDVEVTARFGLFKLFQFKKRERVSI
ncbi:hypothetical protein [Chondrinema litorale]|uniref:hypothetical protein n=1 Tax=Chondrinema litorale TaxID=2994555 RepID=UPI002543E4CC|nr:hypothetical protein [Chondrinema litorale]UZR95315.1 hypothetical protein OQ292_05710 [Chondrinema litorale]